MKLHIGEKILTYRKAEKITQEELAGNLGVSGAAVSKWETGAAYPDIMLLPALARCLGTTVDDLLSFQGTLSAEQVMVFNRECAKTFEQQGFDAGYDLCKRYLQEYPDNAFLKFRIASLWLMYLVKADNEERRQAILEESSQLLKQAAKCGDPKIARAAQFNLGCNYTVIGKLEEAKKIFSSMEHHAENSALMLAAVYRDMGDTKKAEELYQQELFTLVGQINLIFISLAGLLQDPEEKLSLFLTHRQLLAELQISDMMLANNSFMLAVLFAEKQDRQQTLFYLADYVDRLMRQDIRPMGRWFSHVTIMEPVVSADFLRQNARMQMQGETRFAFLVDDPDFQAIIRRI